MGYEWKFKQIFSSTIVIRTDYFDTKYGTCGLNMNLVFFWTNTWEFICRWHWLTEVSRKNSRKIWRKETVKQLHGREWNWVHRVAVQPKLITRIDRNSDYHSWSQTTWTDSEITKANFASLIQFPTFFNSQQKRTSPNWFSPLWKINRFWTPL